MIYQADCAIVLDAQQTFRTWCVWEHIANFGDGKPPEVIMIGMCKLNDVYKLVEGKRNSEWMRIYADGGAVMVRIVAHGTDRVELQRWAAQHARASGRLPRCNISGINVKGTSTPIDCLTNGKRYESQKQACDELGLNRSAFSRHLRGDSAHIGGYVFKYGKPTR